MLAVFAKTTSSCLPDITIVKSIQDSVNLAVKTVLLVWIKTTSKS